MSIERVEPTYGAFRTAARRLLQEGLPPEAVQWEGGTQAGLPLFSAPAEPRRPVANPRVPKAFVRVAERVAVHRDPARLPALYRVLWRLQDARRLMEDAADPDVRRLAHLERAVRQDVHHAHAFVRFRRVDEADGPRFVAWYRPDHFIVPLVEPFFRKRFANQRWAILTPDASVAYDGERSTFGPGVPRTAAPAGDELEGLWRAYYTSTFDPSRVDLELMRQHMPARYWSTLPELEDLPSMVREAPRRVDRMRRGEGSAAEAYVPTAAALPVLAEAAEGCAACPLAGPATRTVFGEGPADARLVLVGEQPGDQEDRSGRPFVGPAGTLLDALLARAGLDRRRLYLTNAVKHFKHTRLPKRRLHQTPDARDIRACYAWLAAELEAIRPACVVALGGTAARSLLGPGFRVSHGRGRVLETPDRRPLVVTNHPAAVLRAGSDERRRRLEAGVIEDLRRAAALAAPENAG